MTVATISAVVPAAGRGTRANLSGNKVLAPLAGHPLLWWTLRALITASHSLSSFQLAEIIVAARPEEWDEIRSIFSSLTETLTTSLPHHPTTSPPHYLLVPGGSIRQESVANAVGIARGDFVMVHDAARPLVSAELVTRVCQAAQQDGAAIPALPASDTVKAAIVDNDRVVIQATLQRETIWLAQTPQVFRRDLLATALDQAALDGFQGTDCASLVERLKNPSGQPLNPVTIVEGETRNFKVTYPPDLDRATSLLVNSKEMPL